MQICKFSKKFISLHRNNKTNTNKLKFYKMKTYKININKNANGSTEIKSFNDLQEAFNYFSKLDVNDLEETNGEGDEYELLPYENDEMQDWTNEELNQIGWTENTWVIRTKISK